MDLIKNLFKFSFGVTFLKMFKLRNDKYGNISYLLLFWK